MLIMSDFPLFRTQLFDKHQHSRDEWGEKYKKESLCDFFSQILLLLLECPSRVLKDKKKFIN